MLCKTSPHLQPQATRLAATRNCAHPSSHSHAHTHAHSHFKLRCRELTNRCAAFRKHEPFTINHNMLISSLRWNSRFLLLETYRKTTPPPLVKKKKNQKASTCFFLSSFYENALLLTGFKTQWNVLRSSDSSMTCGLGCLTPLCVLQKQSLMHRSRSRSRVWQGVKSPHRGLMDG